MYNWSEIMMYDKNHEYLGYITYSDDIVQKPGWSVSLNQINTAYIRVNMHTM